MTAPVPSLIGLGASPTADLVYRRLVTFGRATAGELLHELGMSRRRVTEALDELASLGAAAPRRAAGQGAVVWVPRRDVPVPPPRTPPADRDRHLAAVLSVVPDVVPHATELGDGLRHLRTRAATRARLAELVAVAGQEHLAMNPEPSFDAEAARPAVAMDRTLLLRGVRMRVLGVQAASPDPMSRYGRTTDDPRPAYREAESVPMKLFVVDRKVALFPVAPGDVERGYLEVTQTPVVAALHALFERHWDGGRSAQEQNMIRIALEPRELALVELLAKGHTDSSAARELRVSTRTVSSIVRSLMDRCGVDNRFQLGLALGVRHVVAPPDPGETR
ncbi:helix-turn-helix transcriptional regulator [Phytohabitans houttuyneae]|uniref:Transcriptional regulator n=1 Tax=Phytohabitans houttuyneae TaxID=1076126 RepID=A0A6V8KRS5_9ACTN|nr:helix-turn-helix transcriptional regulator [Phytohabitans houttuyneae]GFJ83325.1 transcriptional regulator [Phytohabitans houttuyneae]